MKRLILSVLITVLVPAWGWSQQAKYRNSFRTGVGYGSYMNEDVEGRGMVLTFGYLRTLKNERVRVNPYISSGGYGSKKLNDLRDQWFSSTNLGCNLWYDAIDETAFAFTLGSGLLLNHMNGLLGDSKSSDEEEVKSEYVGATQVGGYLGAGVRIKNYDGRFNIELVPLNFHFGKMGYLDLYSSACVNIVF
ncbi:MAG: hypothetical protein QM786_13135 [Breznakibacter sp.]